MLALVSSCVAKTGNTNAVFPTSTAESSIPSEHAAPTQMPRETENLWITGPIMGIVSTAPTECFYCYFSVPPKAVLYADGRQIIEHDSALYQRRLSSQEVCGILTRIDRSGFFEYTSAEYEQFYKAHRMKPGPENYEMRFDAWKSNSLDLFSFGFLFSQYKDAVVWPDALRVPYELMTDFEKSSMEPYAPDRVAVHIEKDPGLFDGSGIWKTSGLRSQH
jgi:hypothetical protein